MPQNKLSLQDPKLDSKLAKSNELAKLDFEASVNRGVQSVFKAQDDFVIWGPASVEIVDKEGDKISADALDDALPQLLRRARLSLDHSDQIVGQILERFETEEPVTVEINGETYNKEEFKTDVLELDDNSPPALYVAGEIYDDTRQSQQARKRVEEGELDSYSISGEALVTRKKVEDGVVYDDIIDMDLSAVTLCEEGMNQDAKYARVDGNVSNKETATVAEKEDNVLSIDHPTISNADGTSSTSTSTHSKQPVSKDMSDTKDITSGTKMDDVRDVVQEIAEKAVDNKFPDASLATVDAVEQIVDQKVEQKMESADVSWNNPDSVSGMSEGVDEPDTTTGSEGSADSTMTTNENDQSMTSNKSVAEARQTLATELDVGKEDIDAAISSLLANEMDEDEEDEDEEMEMSDYEDDEEDDEEMEMQNDMDDMNDEDHDYEDDEKQVSMSSLENDLPDDVWKVVQEYVKGSDMDYEDEDEDEDEMEMQEKSQSEVEEKVAEVLTGATGSSEGTSIPSDVDENQVNKQYAGDEDEDASIDGESPALSNLY